MQIVARWWLVAFATLVVAQSRPLVSEETAVIAVSDAAYTEFAGAVAIDGPWALITAAARKEFDPETPNDALNHDSAYFFQTESDDFVAYEP